MGVMSLLGRPKALPSKNMLNDAHDVLSPRVGPLRANTSSSAPESPATENARTTDMREGPGVEAAGPAGVDVRVPLIACEHEHRIAGARLPSPVRPR
jgi:hypothetical protein